MEIVNAPNRNEFLDKLEPTKGTLEWYEKSKDHLDFAEKEKHRFLKDVFERGKQTPTVHAAYGPEEDGYGNAYIDEIIFPEEGGTFTKIYGCPFQIKGISPGNVVFGLQLSKHLFSNFPKSIFKYSKIIPLALGLSWLFNRKGFLNILTDLIHAIDHKVVKHLTYSEAMKGPWPAKWYNNCEKEIERALLEASKGEGLWERLFTLFTPFFKLFLYVDNTYKSRVQDALYKSKNLLECLETLYEREVKTEGNTGKTWKLYKLAFRVMLWTSPALRRIEKKFFKTLEKEKIKMDADDWYFALTYKSYNFRGIPYKERVAERERLNQENHVVYL